MASQAQKTRKKNSDGAIIESLGVEMGNKPPQALDVEQAVLGAMLLEGECVDLAMEELTPSCFYDPCPPTAPISGICSINSHAICK